VKKSTIAAVQYTEARVAHWLLAFFMRPVVHGSDNLQKLARLMQEKSCSTVIIANHINAYDPIYISAIISGELGKEIYPVWLPAKKRFFATPFKDRAMRYHGCLPIGIGKDEDSLRSMKEIIEKVRSGDTICVFPEGQVSADGLPGPDMGFVTFLARRSNLIIQPVNLSGLVGFKTEWLPVLLCKRRLTLAFGEPLLLERGTVVDSMPLIKEALAAHAE
jgi:1-acyl-sn-glycerol-3-phosphate acyltransferase